MIRQWKPFARLVSEFHKSVARTKNGLGRTVDINIGLQAQARMIDKSWPRREAFDDQMARPQSARYVGEARVVRLDPFKPGYIVLEAPINLRPDPSRELISTSQ